MEGPVTTRAALLQALRHGPAYGRELLRRIADLAAGRLRLSEGHVYSVLQELQQQGLVSASAVSPRGKRGARLRIYYDLTVAGCEAAASDRAILKALAAARPREHYSRRARSLMARRLAEAEALNAAGEELLAARAAKSR